MNVYAESSGVLAWWLGESTGDAVQAALAAAVAVAASELTLVECERALRRAQQPGALREADAAELRGVLLDAARSWHLQRLDETVLRRARDAFPHEPARTLDAIHLSSALQLAAALPQLVVLSLDERVRRNAAELGFAVLP